MKLMVAALMVLASCAKSETNESTEALCTHMVKLTKADLRNSSSLELEASCKEVIESARNIASGPEFTEYAKCIYETERSADLRDCYLPLKTKDATKAREEREAGMSRLTRLQEELNTAQAEIERAQDVMDEAFRDLKAARNEEEREAARGKRRKAKIDLAAKRAELQAIRRSLTATTQ